VNAIWDELHADGTLLPKQTIGMNISCADNTLMRVTVTDPMVETKIAHADVRTEAWFPSHERGYPSRYFGLGSVGGKKLGAFQIHVNNIELSWNTAGGVSTGPGRLFDIDSNNKLGPFIEGMWLLTTAYGTTVGNAFSDIAQFSYPLRAVKTVSADLNIYSTINKTGALPRQDVINLNGRVNFELFIL
jgi:hypothetical protein